MREPQTAKPSCRCTVSAIVPAYNPGPHLDEVLSKLLKWVPCGRITVVDDGSHDATASEAVKHHVKLIRLESNQGKGTALRTGLHSVKGEGADAILTIDADGQHDPDSIPRFIESMERTGADLVIGKRDFRPSRMPLDRVFSNRISSWLLSIKLRRPIPDSQCGYRLYRAAKIQELDIESTGYEVETELLIKGIRAGWKLEFCPIETLYNHGPSHVHRIRDTVRFLRTLFRFSGIQLEQS